MIHIHKYHDLSNGVVIFCVMGKNGKRAEDGIQLVSVTNHFKFEAPDGKQRTADALDAGCVLHRAG